MRGREETRNGRREERSVVGRKRGRGGGRQAGVKAGMEERGRHFTWEDGTDGWRKGGRDGWNGGR